MRMIIVVMALLEMASEIKRLEIEDLNCTARLRRSINSSLELVQDYYSGPHPKSYNKDEQVQVI